MTHQELRMRCDLFKTGANSHKVNNLYFSVINSIQLYLMNDDMDECFLQGVNQLHTLNGMIHTSAKFTDLVKSYIPVFNKEWNINI